MGLERTVTLGSEFEVAQREWARIPLDDIGYVAAHELLELPYKRFLQLLAQAERNRYTGWRNHRDLWYRHLIEGVTGQTVLDFGCGAGIESLQFARRGNRIILADINEVSVDVAKRLLCLHGFELGVQGTFVTGEYPFVVPGWPVDVFYANGVLHHIRWMPELLARAEELLSDHGEVRLMLYTDAGWRIATATEPPPGDPRDHPEYQRFLRFFDAVGEYAEPWWPSKLEQAAAIAGLRLDKWAPLTPDGRYAAARMLPW